VQPSLGITIAIAVMTSLILIPCNMFLTRFFKEYPKSVLDTAKMDSLKIKEPTPCRVYFGYLLALIIYVGSFYSNIVIAANLD